MNGIERDVRAQGDMHGQRSLKEDMLCLWEDRSLGEDSRICDTAYFYGLSLSTVLINRSRKQSFSKTLFEQEELEYAGVSFSCARNTF